MTLPPRVLEAIEVALSEVRDWGTWSGRIALHVHNGAPVEVEVARKTRVARDPAVDSTPAHTPG